MDTVLRILQAAGGWNHGLHLRIDNPPYMALVIEATDESGPCGLPAIGEADKKKRPRPNPESHLFRMPRQRSRFAVRGLYLRLASQWAVPTP